MNKLDILEPSKVWHFFGDICTIPRPSKKEGKIIEYLFAFAKANNLSVKRDDVGNVLISKPASPGMENNRTIVLQSHLDMVCEKNTGTVHNFDTDPIIPLIDGEWVTAEGTTLGADCGIGISAQLAVLSSDELRHGPLECLFTVDEETGLTGAKALQPGFFSGKVLINVDSEDEGQLFIGCAGGIDTVASIRYKPLAVPKGFLPLKLSITGLSGGHSGDDINKGRGNAIKILNRFIWNLSQEMNVQLASFEGGNLRNAIAREAFADVLIPFGKREKAAIAFNIFRSDIENELAFTEPKIKFSLESNDQPRSITDPKTKENLLNSLYACPHGILAMSSRMQGMVETSTNLASVRFIEGNIIEITTSQRSDLESSKNDAASMVESVFEMIGAEVEHGEGYPGWTPDPSSEVLQVAKTSYTTLFHMDPVVRSIHAGLECGLFLQKFPDLDMISFGPTIKEAHSPDEKIHIGSVQKFWALLVHILANFE
jgi:dipeptidase D